MRDDILGETTDGSTSMRCTVRPLDSRRAIATLLQRDIPVRRMVIGSLALEFDPGRRNDGTALDPALETRRQRDEMAGLGRQFDALERVIEVGPRGAVAVPVVVVEEVGARLVRFVVQVDAHFALVLLGLVGRRRLEMFHHPDLLHGRAVGVVSLVVPRCRITV